MFRDSGLFLDSGAGPSKTSGASSHEHQGLIWFVVAMFAISLIGYILIVVLAIARM